jgi:glycosyltransferase involved in cell wall biosynthesis
MDFVIHKEKKPTLSFITMCKNEEHIIEKTLESVYKYIDYWIVCDTGSTDNTCEIVKNFFNKKNIPGELFIDEWMGFGKHKTYMFEKAYNKTDYVLHLDADDLLVGNFVFDVSDNSDQYEFNYKRGNSIFKCTSLYKNNLRWKYCGVAHNIIRCLDKEDIILSSFFIKDDLWVDCEDIGARSFDPEKYSKDAKLLEQQFWDTLYNDEDGLNNRSVFYTAQSLMDSKQYEKALNWYCLYTKLKNTWIEEVYESYLRISELLILLERSYSEIERQINKTISIFPDRAEGYYILGKFCNENKLYDKAYILLKHALEKNYANICEKYTLFVRIHCYHKHLYDELSVACYWINKLDEGKKYLQEIIDDPIFSDDKKRFQDNMKYYNIKMNE